MNTIFPDVEFILIERIIEALADETDPVADNVFVSVRKPPANLSPYPSKIVTVRAQGGSNIVLLTLLGGGVFGNAPEWIHTAIKRALSKVQDLGLDVRLVSYGPPSIELCNMLEEMESPSEPVCDRI